MTVDDIKSGFLHHAAMAQARRWYQYYENPAVGLKNQLDILDPSISVRSGLGEAKGHVAYGDRVTKLPADWKNAHFVRKHTAQVGTDGSINLKLDITYLNQGMLPDGAVRTADLAYDTVLKRGSELLPKFQSIAITQNSESKAAAFKSAYAENRLQGLVHYWLAIIEDPSRNPDPAREILAGQCSLNFSSGAITSFDGFKAWLAGPGSRVTASTHIMSHFAYEETGPNMYNLSVEFDWEGIQSNGKGMTAKTRHRWIVADDPAERFARIQTVDVDALKPLTPHV
jgi:hypothetical protein